jgi:hypothetical protein
VSTACCLDVASDSQTATATLETWQPMQVDSHQTGNYMSKSPTVDATEASPYYYELLQSIGTTGTCSSMWYFRWLFVAVDKQPELLIWVWLWWRLWFSLAVDTSSHDRLQHEKNPTTNMYKDCVENFSPSRYQVSLDKQKLNLKYYKYNRLFCSLYYRTNNTVHCNFILIVRRGYSKFATAKR